MARQEANYLHSSLYTFDDDARSEVVRRFRAAMNDDTVTLNYRGPEDTFLLQCPAERGAIADASLRNIIKDYISSELEAAEEEDRKPHVVRFRESIVDEIGALSDGDSTPSVPAVVRQSSSAPRTLIIITPEDEGRLVKLFRLHDLQSHGLLERALAQPSSKSRRIMSKGLVCRAARWSNSDGHVFNGRVGSHNTGRTATMVAPLHLPPFQWMYDRREGVEPFLAEVEKPVWSFAGGQEDTSVKQWLQGTGDTRQEVPGAKAEIPRDAEQYLAKAQTHTAGRARVVKGQSILAHEIIEDSSSDSDSHFDNFASMLRPETGISAIRTVEPDARSDVSDRSAESHHGAFQDLLPGVGVRAIDQLDPGRSSTLQLAFATDHTLRKEQFRRQQATGPEKSVSTLRVPENESLTAASLHASSEWGNSYYEGFAKVDTLGLTANAKSTAQWENNNRSVLQTKRDKARGSDRLAFRKPVDDVLPRAENQLPQRQTTASICNVPGAQQYHAQPYNDADATWSNHKSTRWTAASVPLINIDTLEHNSANPDLTPVKIPPGFHYVASEHESPDSETSRERLILLDLVDDDVPASAVSDSATISRNAPMLSQLPQAPIDVESYAVAVQQTSDDGPIEERIQPLPKGYAKTYRTMNQQAGYKMKGKKNKGKKTEHKVKAQLELPEAAPAPKAKQRKQDLPAKKSDTQIEIMSGPTEASSLSRFKPSTRITRENHPFGRMLRSEILKLESYEIEDELVPMARRPKLAARLGLLLVRRDDKEDQDIAFGARDPLEMQSSLREASLRTDFLPRLTTSVDDAATILEVASPRGLDTGSQNSRVVLELIIQETASGDRLKLSIPVTVNGADKANFSVTTKDRTLAEASCHYAVHVWDAQFTLVQSEGKRGSVSTNAIDELIASMNTDGKPPSFRGKTPKDAFTVERVLAKRIFETEKSGIVFRLSEVQDLVLEPLSLRDYNLQALALSHQEMVADQRYWWEAGWETVDLSRADAMQAWVDDMVKQVDDVGLENKGPFVICEGYQSDAEPEVVGEQPFW